MNLASKALHAACAAFDRAERALANNHAEEARHHDEATRASQAAEAATDAQAAADAAAITAGGNVTVKADDTAVRETRAAAAHEKAAVQTAARQPALEDLLKAAKRNRAGAVLAFMRAERDAALGDFQNALEALIGPLARLLAAEAVRAELLPAPFAFEPAQHPPAQLWSGGQMAVAILDTLPPRATPSGFSAKVHAEADALTEDIFQRKIGKRT